MSGLPFVHPLVDDSAARSHHLQRGTRVRSPAYCYYYCSPIVVVITMGNTLQTYEGLVIAGAVCAGVALLATGTALTIWCRKQHQHHHHHPGMGRKRVMYVNDNVGDDMEAGSDKLMVSGNVINRV